MEDPQRPHLTKAQAETVFRAGYAAAMAADPWAHDAAIAQAFEDWWAGVLPTVTHDSRAEPAPCWFCYSRPAPPVTNVWPS